MLVYIIIMGIVLGVSLYLLNKSNGTDHVGFSLKCPQCGYHKGILKCVNCEDRKKDKWR